MVVRRLSSPAALLQAPRGRVFFGSAMHGSVLAPLTRPRTPREGSHPEDPLETLQANSLGARGPAKMLRLSRGMVCHDPGRLRARGPAKMM